MSCAQVLDELVVNFVLGLKYIASLLGCVD